MRPPLSIPAPHWPCLLLLLLGLALRPAHAQLVVLSPHPKDFVDAIVQEFEVETGIKVEVVSAGTGELLKRIEAGASRPASRAGDVMWGGSRASLEAYKAYFEPYASVNTPSIIPRYLEEGRAYTPFTAVPTVIMYNRNLIAPGQEPRSWAELLDQRWKGSIAFADPRSSSSSFEALVNMLFAAGRGDPEQGWGYISAFIDNLGGRLAASSSEVYGGVASGAYALGVTFEEAAAIYLKQGAPVGIVYPAEGTVVEPDGVAVLKGARNLDAARRFVDFVTSRKIQAAIAKNLNRRSCRLDVGPASGLADLKDVRVIPGDYRWAGKNKERLLKGFAALIKP